jgi:hypothetical protein
MTAKMLIGVGGTGAKVVEAILHCCGAGLGPATLQVGFIDQDKSNGNVSRANQTLTAYMEARQNWRGDGAHHIEGSDLLATDVTTFKRSLWTPHPDDGSSLESALGDLGGDGKLFDLLFTQEEQRLKLDIGYQARAHVGSAAMTAAIRKESDPFWVDIVNKLIAAGGGDGVDLLLVGSAFGGTGAAGFPTVARLLRRELDRKGIRKGARISGVLMLPYFGFTPPKRGATVARADELLPQTKAALRYYHDLFEREHVFDEAYLVGWNSKFELGYHNPGKGGQINPALLPELIAAVGACGFFAGEPPKQPPKERVRTEVLVSARHEEHRFGWGDLPPVRDERPNEVYAQLGRQIRFAAAWKHWQPILNREAGAFRNSYRKRAWFKGYGLGGLDTTDAAFARAITSMDRYVDSFAQWALTIQLLSKQSGGSEEMAFDLWDMNGFLSQPSFRKDENSPLTVPVARTLDEASYASAFDRAVGSRAGVAPLTTAADLMRAINERPQSSRNSGLGGIVAALHSNSAVAAGSDGGI